MPYPGEHENDPTVLAALFAASATYWENQGRLTASQHRRKQLEEDVICSFAGGEHTPPAWVIRDVRSGNADRDRTGRLRWRREGYALDSEHRVVAPRRAPTFARRPGVAVVARPREQGRRRSRVTRAGPFSDDDPHPEPPAQTDVDRVFLDALARFETLREFEELAVRSLRKAAFLFSIGWSR